MEHYNGALLYPLFPLICFVRMLKGRSFPGKVLLTRRSEPLSPPEYSPRYENDRDEYEQNEGSQEVMWHWLASLSACKQVSL